MKKTSKLAIYLPLLAMGMMSLSSCSNNENVLYLRVINSEDYIYVQESPDDEIGMKEQFENSDMVKEFLETKYPQYSRVEVIYDTSDTNETLYSELQTGKSNYDLMNVSEYMAQKIVGGKMAVPLYRHQGASIDDEVEIEIENYQHYASKNIVDRLNSIEATQKTFNEKTNKLEEGTVQLKDYAVGYMWGTLGILFNPEYPVFEEREIDSDEVITDMQSFDALWDTKYNRTISIKNSMRDTYALGLLHAYEDEFAKLREEYLQTHDVEKYQEEFSKVFNRCSEKEVEDVRLSLEELKENIFGLEVDSGKQDIITKKIGINLAWSGDAVYSMDQGENPNEVKELVELCYAVPELGSNVWMDVWIMPDCKRSQEQYELAHLWLDFLSDPENANQNMDYTGYTSFIGGNSILELVRDWYDYRTDEMYQEIERKENGKYYYDYFQIYAYKEETGKFFALDYPDFLSWDEEEESGHNPAYDSYKLCYFIPYTVDGELVEEPENLDDLLNPKHSKPVLLDDDSQKTYFDLTIVNVPGAIDPDGQPIEVVDLSYFFNKTLEYDEELDEGYLDDIDTIFYSNCYLPFEYEDENGIPQHNISVGRQFFCQYPDEDTINRCGTMSDYGENNKYVMKMWENFKSNPLPIWAIVIFAISIAAMLAFVTYLVINKILKNNLRKKRKN